MTQSSTYHPVVLDTSVLLLLIAYAYLVQTDVVSPRRYQIIGDIRGKDPQIPWRRYDDLWHIFEYAGKRLVTQHVVSEIRIDRLCGNLKASTHEFWKVAEDLFRQYALEEHSCPFIDLYGNKAYRALVQKLGPTDAGLILVAKREGGVLLTDGDALRSRATSAGVACWFLGDLA